MNYEYIINRLMMQRRVKIYTNILTKTINKKR